MTLYRTPKNSNPGFSSPRIKPTVAVKINKNTTPPGLVEYYLMNGTKRGLLGHTLISGNSAFTFPAVSKNHGKEIRVIDTGSSSTIDAGDVVQPSGACSMFFGFYSNIAIANGDRTFANNGAASILSRNNGSGNAEFLINPLTNDRVSHSWSPQIGELVILGGSWGGNDTPLKVYSKTKTDGIKITTNGATSTGTYSISANTLNPLSTLDGGFIFAIFFDKQIPDVQARRIMESNGDSLLEPQSPSLYFTPEAAGGITLTADSGTYSYVGTNVGLLTTRILQADSGAYTYIGTSVNLLRGFTLTANTGAYVYTGTDATLTFTPVGAFTLIAETGTYTYSGTDINFNRNRVMIASSGVYTYSGADIQIILPGQIWTDKASVSTSWGDQASVVTNWTNQTNVTTTWTDK